MARTATVVYVGDASSMIRASAEAAAAAEGAEAKISAAGSKVGASYLSMSGAGKSAAKELESVSGRIGSAFAGIATSGNAAVAGVVALGAAVAGVKHAATVTDEVATATLKLHNVTGLSIESASAYAAVAKVQDLNSRQLNQAFGTLSKNVQAVTNAHDGLTKAAKTQENAFKLLGLPLHDIYQAHGDLDKLLPEVIDRFEKMHGGIEKTAVGMALFGRGWQTLVPLMHSGALGLKEQLETAKAMGATLEGHGVKSLKEFQKAQDEAKYATLGLNLAIGQYAAPALTKLIVAFANLVKEIRTGAGSIGQTTHQIGEAFQAIWKVAQPAIKTTEAIVDGFIGSLKGIAEVIKGIFTLNFSEAWHGVVDIFRNGAHAAVAAFLAFETPVFAAAKIVWGGISKAVGGVWGSVSSAISSIFNKAAGVVEGFFNTMYDAAKYIVDGLVKGLESKAGEVASAVAKVVTNPIGTALNALGIKSPSKVTEHAGEMIGEGYAIGITKAHPKIKAAMASVARTLGGFSAAPGTNYKVGEEPTIAKRLDELAKYLGVKLTGISGYRTPQHSVEVGGSANDPHTRGQASDTEGAQKIAESVLEKFGLTRPFAGAKEANHIQLLAGGSAAAVHTALKTMSGKISWFGGPNDKEDSGHTASGGTTAEPGISTYNRSTLGGYWRVKLPNGKVAVLKQTDIGPAPWTGRKFDFTYSALKQLGYTEKNFPTDASITGEYLGKNPRAAGTSGGRAAVEPKFALGGAAGRVAGWEGTAATMGAWASRYGTYASEAASDLQRYQARWAAKPNNLTTAAGAHAEATERSQAVATRAAEVKYYKREIDGLQREVNAWSKARDAYRKAARRTPGPKAKKEALDKAAALQAKIDQAKAAARELQGTIYSTETEQIEAENQAAKLPEDIAHAQEEHTGADLNAYQAANSKADLEVRAGVISAAEGKARKEQNARTAINGGYGQLSEEGLLQAKGDLKEFQEAVTSDTSAVENHTKSLEEATKTLHEFNVASERLANVENTTLVKAMADMISGQIAGRGYHPAAAAPGGGTAARY